MVPVDKLFLAVFTFVTAFGLLQLFHFLYRQSTSPLRHLRGPKASWVYGNVRDILKDDNSVLHEEWVKRYGNTLKYKGLFYSNRLFTVDPQALQYVLTHDASDFRKATDVKYTLSQILGKGLLVVDGAQHRQQRHIMNPAFGPAQIRALTDVFSTKAVHLRDAWLSEIAKGPTATDTGVRLDVLLWLGRATLDIIGLAGFNCDPDAVNANDGPNELREAFASLILAAQKMNVIHVLQAWFPLLRLIPTDRSRKIEVARRTIARVGNQLLSDAKAAARASMIEKGEIEKKSFLGRDLLSLLVKANMATDIPESQRLHDEDVLAQVPTFLLAGHETTSTATSWALFATAVAPEIQKQLREELLSVDTETPSMDELVALPYLDAVLRETLRMYPPIPITERTAARDSVLPVGQPYTDQNGVAHDSICVGKGESIVISILAMNRSQEVWGPDAHEFKPERWENVPEAATRLPGVWGNQMTFSTGPRACIGYRFSLVEMKALLFTLVRAFEFELAVPASEIGERAIIVLRPVLLSDPNRKAQLPLLVKPYRRAELTASPSRLAL